MRTEKNNPRPRVQLPRLLKELPHHEGVPVGALQFREIAETALFFETRRFVQANGALIVGENRELDLVVIQKPAFTQARLDQLATDAFRAVLGPKPHAKLTDMRPGRRLDPLHRAPSHDPIAPQSEDRRMARRIELREKLANLVQRRRLGHQKIFLLARNLIHAKPETFGPLQSCGKNDDSLGHLATFQGKA